MRLKMRWRQTERSSRRISSKYAGHVPRVILNDAICRFCIFLLVLEPESYSFNASDSRSRDLHARYCQARLTIDTHCSPHTSMHDVEELHVSIHSKIKFYGITQLLAVGEHYLIAKFDGAWTLEFHIPKPTSDNQYCGVYIKPPPNVIQKEGESQSFRVTASLQLFNGELYRTKSLKYTWDADHPRGRGWKTFARWDRFWLNNPESRKHDGFRIIVDITSTPNPTRPVVSDPLLLHDLSRLIDGEDIIDTKFLLFSGRAIDDRGIVGANAPMAVYASSKFLKCHSDYFETSTLHCWLMDMRIRVLTISQCSVTLRIPNRPWSLLINLLHISVWICMITLPIAT